MSTNTNNDTITDTDLDVIRIEQAILHERQGHDRGWWDQMGAAFADDSQVSLPGTAVTDSASWRVPSG